MAKVPINLFGVGVGESGKSLNVTAASRTNIYFDIQPAPGDKAMVAAYNTAGAVPFADLPDTTQPANSAYTTSDGQHMFVIQGNKFYELDAAGTFTLRATLQSAPTGQAEMADNGKQVAIAVGYGLYCYVLQTQVMNFVFFDGVASANVSANTITFQDGYFIAGVKNAPNGNPDAFYLSSLYDGTAWFSLDFGVPEFQADSLTKVIGKNGVLYLFGTRTTEVWQDIGDLNFPYQRIAGAQTEWGLFAQHSLVSVSSVMIGLMVNRQNDIGIMLIDGYTPRNITPPDLAYRIKHFSAPADCAALSYSMAGHDFYQISWETDGETWLYDLSTDVWARIKSGITGRHVGKVAFPFLLTTKSLVTDYQKGRVYVLDDKTYTDDGVTNYREIVGTHIFMPDRQTFTICSISLDMEHGLVPEGQPIKVRLSLSRDGGHNFQEEYEDSSKIGEYTRFYQFNRLGRGRDVVPRIRMTEPVKFVLITAIANIESYGW